mmetsp:Transcript_26240/g.57381  ORF Transcript_26240/g.57381 Transcript_26240/m.57381 type:complete len:240 (+) Transcript_26240:335-1054(+)
MPMPKATPTQPVLEVAPTANPTSSDIQVEGFLPLVSSFRKPAISPTESPAAKETAPGTTSIWYPTVMNSKTSPMQPQISDTYFSIISTPFLTTFPVFLAAFLAPFPAFLAPFFIFLPKPPFFFLLLLLLLSPLLLGLELSFFFLLLPLASSSSSLSSLSSLVSLTASRALELDILSVLSTTSSISVGSKSRLARFCSSFWNFPNSTWSNQTMARVSLTAATAREYGTTKRSMASFPAWP